MVKYGTKYLFGGCFFVIMYKEATFLRNLYYPLHTDISNSLGNKNKGEPSFTKIGGLI